MHAALARRALGRLGPAGPVGLVGPVGSAGRLGAPRRGGAPVSAGPGSTAPAAQPAPEVPSGGLRARASAGIVWAAAEKWLVRLSTTLGFVLLGRLLGPDEFGVVAFAMVFIGLLTVVADAGFATFLVQRPTIDRTLTSTGFWLSTAFGLVLAPGLALAAPAIAGLTDKPVLAQVLPALAAALLLSALSTVPAALLQRELRFKELATRQIAATVSSVVAAVALALAGFGVWALVAQTLVRAAVAFAMLWRATDFRPAWEFSRTGAGEMVSYGSKSLGVQLLRQARIDGEAFLIGLLAGATTLGYWVIAVRLVDVITDLCSSVFGRVAHPVFARLQHDSARLGRALGTATALGALVLVPTLVLLALTSDVVVPAVFGQTWVPAAGVAAVLAFRALANGLSDFQRSVLMATGRAGTELVVSLVQFVVQVALVVLLADDGLVPLAAALAAWAVLMWPVRAVVLWRERSIPWRTYVAAELVVLSAAVAAAAVVGVRELAGLEGWAGALLAAGVGGVVYTAMVLLLCGGVVTAAVDALPAGVRRRLGPLARLASPTP